MKYLSLVYSTARGSIGGIVYSQNANGAYTRAKVVPANRNTAKQSAVRALIAAVSKYWRTMSTMEQDSFVTHRKDYPYIDSLGLAKFYTGFQLMVKVNNLMAIYGEPSIRTMVAPVSMIAITRLFVNGFAAGVTLEIAAQWSDGLGVVPPNCALILDASRKYPNTGYAPKNSDFRFMLTYPAGTDISLYNMYSFYKDVFGNLAVNDVFFVRGRILSLITGQITTPFWSAITLG